MIQRFFPLLLLLLSAGSLCAGESDYGKVHPKAPAEAAQFDFLKGKWDVATTWTKPDGETVQYKATFTCSYQAGGTMFEQEWKGPYTSGKEFRYYNPAKKKWEGYNIYMGSGWQPTEPVFEDGKVYIYIKVDDQRGKFIGRETYINITANSWEMTSERSYDDGKTWEKGKYSLKATRME